MIRFNFVSKLLNRCQSSTNCGRVNTSLAIHHGGYQEQYKISWKQHTTTRIIGAKHWRYQVRGPLPAWSVWQTKPGGHTFPGYSPHKRKSLLAATFAAAVWVCCLTSCRKEFVVSPLAISKHKLISIAAYKGQKSRLYPTALPKAPTLRIPVLGSSPWVPQ